MRFKTLTVILLAFASTGFAQEHMAENLRNGILEEDSKQNPDGAIRQYQAVLNEFAAARQTAANALFRMAECFRKQGNRRAAISAYQRVVRDFGDQPKLVGQSRNVLTNEYKVAAVVAAPASGENDRAKFDKLMEQQKEEQAGVTQARARYRATIQSEIDVLTKQVDVAEQRNRAGAGNFDEITDAKLKLLQRERDLAAFDAGMK